MKGAMPRFEDQTKAQIQSHLALEDHNNLRLNFLTDLYKASRRFVLAAMLITCCVGMWAYYSRDNLDTKLLKDLRSSPDLTRLITGTSVPQEPAGPQGPKGLKGDQGLQDPKGGNGAAGPKRDPSQPADPPSSKTALESSDADATIWYRQPAQQWLEAMPLGNGMIGAMVFGGVPEERIALNESSFWSGRPHDYDDTNAFQFFPQIRDLVFAGKFQEAEKMVNDHFYGKPKAQEAYQPIGDLLLDFGTTNFTDYRRELDMETGVAKVSYRSGDAVITREMFVSWPDRVLVVRISADKPGRVSFGAQFRGPYLETSVAERDRLIMDGTWNGPFPGPATGMAGLIAHTTGKGLRYETALVARLEGGRSEAVGSTLNITNADAVTLVMALATSFVNYQDISVDPVTR
ncbi:MAG TPA: glycoside hydrolase N-terminal domain-containing protein, partial [Verrucomicrobiae bacterium]